MSGYDKGYISLYRKFKNWRYYKNDNIKSVFIHCLLSAYWKDETITEYNGKPITPILVKRGSFITSYRKMAKDLEKNIGEIRYALDKLSTPILQHSDTTQSCAQEISVVATHMYTIINVHKFNDFQPLFNFLQHSEFENNNTEYNTHLQQQLNKIDNKDKTDITDITDKSTHVQSNHHNSLTNLLIKKGYISESDIPEDYDMLFERYLENYDYPHMKIIVNYILKRANPNRIKNKYSYLKKSINANIKKLESLRSRENEENNDTDNNDFMKLLDELKRGEL